METANNKIPLDPKWFWSGILTIVILFVSVVFLVFDSNRGIKLNTSGVEITPPTPERKDSVKIVTIPTAAPIEPKEIVRRQSPKSATVRDSSVIVQDQPAIVNTGTNNGVMGNNNSNIIVNPKPRLNEDEKPKLLQYVNQILLENSKDKTGCIEVFTPSNNLNPDSKYLVEDIKKTLILNGFKAQSSMVGYADNFNYTRPINLRFDKHSGCLHIIVWLN